MLVHVIYKLAQVAAVMGFSPLVAGVIHRLKEVVQSKHGPSIFQPYRDISKLFHKDQVISEESSWIFQFRPYVVFVAPIVVTLLIPVLTNYPLFLAFMGDMLAGGFVLALAGDLFLLCTFSMVATRQVQDCIRFFFFIWQSIFFALSAFLLGLHPVVWDLLAVGSINLVNKPILIAWLLRKTMPDGFRRGGNSSLIPPPPGG